MKSDQLRWAPTPPVARAALVAVFLYLFLVGIGFLEAGIAALGGRFQAGLLASVSHPLAGLSAGILATVLVQSSSVTTSTIVGMVGAGTLPLSLAVPMIMGANIGTTITNTLASLGTMRRASEFQRAFAAATIHDFFNLLAVLVLLPLELSTGLLRGVAEWLTGIALGAELDPTAGGKGPIRKAIALPIGWVEGLLEPGGIAAAVFLVLGLLLIFLSLALITSNMRLLVAEKVERVMNRVIGRGGGVVGMLVGVGVTAAVQSSSITTSILVPLVAAGVLTVRNAYPITLGANVGTTVTALIASLAVARPEGLTIALVHLLFNLVGIAILYPAPALRHVPIRLAERLAAVAVRRHRVVLVYTVTIFLILPVLGVLLIR